MAQVEQTGEGERLADTPTGASGDPGGAISEPTELQRPRPLNRGGRKWWSLAGAIVCMGACVVSAGLFLPHQSLWYDEATQLYGVGLDPVEVTRWLAGWSHHNFGIPSDRMPPVSYWAQQAWAKVFGLSELAMRSFSLVCVAASILVVHSAARRVGRARRIHGGDSFCALAQRGDQRDRDPLLPAVLARIGCDVLVPHATTRGFARRAV